MSAQRKFVPAGMEDVRFLFIVFFLYDLSRFYTKRCRFGVFLICSGWANQTVINSHSSRCAYFCRIFLAFRMRVMKVISCMVARYGIILWRHRPIWKWKLFRILRLMLHWMVRRSRQHWRTRNRFGWRKFEALGWHVRLLSKFFCVFLCMTVKHVHFEDSLCIW